MQAKIYPTGYLQMSGGVFVLWYHNAASSDAGVFILI